MKEKFRIIKRWEEYLIEKKFLFWWFPYIEYDGEFDTWFWVWGKSFNQAEEELKMITNKRNLSFDVIQEYEFDF